MGGDHLWDAIGAVGEFVGAMAVVVSVVYLSFQIRTNTRQIQSSEAHRFADEQNRLLEVTLSSRDHAELLTKLAGDEELSSPERTRAYAFSVRLINIWSAAESAYRKGQVDERYYQDMCCDVRDVISDFPFLLKYFRRHLDRRPQVRGEAILQPILDDRAVEASESQD